MPLALRCILVVVALLIGAVYCLTIWVEVVTGHWMHVAAIMSGAALFMLVGGALLAILDGRGR